MSRSDRERELARARERADLARLRFGNAVHGVLERLTPDRLRAEAIEAATDQFEQAKRDLMHRFRHWPIVLGSVAAGLLALLFWRPARVALRYGLRAVSIATAVKNLWRPSNEQDRSKA
ncbi:MAG: hypothetical protein J7494_10840 [Sphingobium sp.]|nr:hypothetical protein [Sphingobium sp.]